MRKNKDIIRFNKPSARYWSNLFIWKRYKWRKILINSREKVGLKQYDDPKGNIEYSDDIQDVKKYWWT